MKIYLAGSFAAQKRLRPIRDKLWALGHEVVGTWLDEIAVPTGMSQDIFNKQLAIKDLTEVKSADCFIIDVKEESTTGGRMVELGYALGQAKLKYLVGENQCIFLNLVDQQFNNWDELFAHFEKEHGTHEYVATGMEDRKFSMSGIGSGKAECHT